MKKWMFLFFFLLLLFYSIKVEQTEEVFAMNQQQGNQIWCLDVSKSSFTSKDLIYFSDVKIFEVYPKNEILGLDESAKRQLSRFLYYSISKLEEAYSHKLKKLGLFEEVEKVERVGILLNGIKVFGEKEKLDKLNISNLVLTDLKKCNSTNE